MDAIATSAVSFFELMEKHLDSHPVPTEANTLELEEVQGILKDLLSLRRLVRAYRRYPVFDPCALTRLKRQTIPGERPGLHGMHHVEVEVWVPVFAWSHVNASGDCPRDGFMVGCGQPPRFAQDIVVRFDHSLISGNQDTLRTQDGYIQVRDLQATAPPIPLPVRRSIKKAHQEFEDVMLVWEANWIPAPVGDPLVIGVEHNVCFLVDEYDTTKLEKYISREFTKG